MKAKLAIVMLVMLTIHIVASRKQYLLVEVPDQPDADESVEVPDQSEADESEENSYPSYSDETYGTYEADADEPEELFLSSEPDDSAEVSIQRVLHCTKINNLPFARQP